MPAPNSLRDRWIRSTLWIVCLLTCPALGCGTADQSRPEGNLELAPAGSDSLKQEKPGTEPVLINRLPGADSTTASAPSGSEGRADSDSLALSGGLPTINSVSEPDPESPGMPQLPSPDPDSPSDDDSPTERDTHGQDGLHILEILEEEVDFFLSRFVLDGKVSYSMISADQKQLDLLVAQIASADIYEAEENVRKAFLINAYNVLVIRNVIDHWPLESPLDVPGFFDQLRCSVAETEMTLSDLENTVIRPEFGDARIHFALVCAAEGCPSLPSQAFRASRVEQQLDEVTQAAMNDQSFTRLDPSGLGLSQIFNWYRADFPGEGPGDLIPWINQYRGAAISADAELSFYDYDWAINGR